MVNASAIATINVHVSYDEGEGKSLNRSRGSSEELSAKIINHWLSEAVLEFIVILLTIKRKIQ